MPQRTRRRRASRDEPRHPLLSSQPDYISPEELSNASPQRNTIENLGDGWWIDSRERAYLDYRNEMDRVIQRYLNCGIFLHRQSPLQHIRYGATDSKEQPKINSFMDWANQIDKQT